MTKKLNDIEGKFLLNIARTTISNRLNQNNENENNLKNENDDDKLKNSVFYEKRGTFVTLHKDGDLRGCIGTLEPIFPVIKGIRDNAINAAFKDSRFPPLKKNELKNVNIEISILTKPEKLEYSDTDNLLLQLKPNIHGVILQKKHHKATFLPQVWEQLPDPEEFLSHLCQKAGLYANEWEKGDVEIMTYQVEYYKEK